MFTFLYGSTLIFHAVFSFGVVVNYIYGDRVKLYLAGGLLMAVHTAAIVALVGRNLPQRWVFVTPNLLLFLALDAVGLLVIHLNKKLEPVALVAYYTLEGVYLIALFCVEKWCGGPENSP